MDHFFSRGNPSPSSSAAHPICGSNKASAESLHTPQHSKCGFKESGNAHSFIVFLYDANCWVLKFYYGVYLAIIQAFK